MDNVLFSNRSNNVAFNWMTIMMDRINLLQWMNSEYTFNYYHYHYCMACLVRYDYDRITWVLFVATPEAAAALCISASNKQDCNLSTIIFRTIANRNHSCNHHYLHSLICNERAITIVTPCIPCLTPRGHDLYADDVSTAKRALFHSMLSHWVKLCAQEHPVAVHLCLRYCLFIFLKWLLRSFL